MQRVRGRALGLAVVLLLVACGTTGPVSWFNLADLAAASDAGPSTDAAVDAGEPADGAEFVPDSGEPADGAVAVENDAGPHHAPDAGEPSDASVCQPSLPGISQVSAACEMCAENACPMQIMTAESACSSYSQCVCGCAGDQSCVNGCQMDVSRACQTSLQPVEQCAIMSCESECEMMGPPPGSDGGVVINPGGDGGIIVMNPPDGGSPCATLAACCPTLPGMYQSLCTGIVNRGNDGQCQMALSEAMGEGYCQ